MALYDDNRHCYTRLKQLKALLSKAKSQIKEMLENEREFKMKHIKDFDKEEFNSIDSLNEEYFSELEKENLSLKKKYREIVKKFKFTDYELKIQKNKVKELQEMKKEDDKFIQEINDLKKINKKM